MDVGGPIVRGCTVCGRFVLMTPGKGLAERFELEETPELAPRYNIAPTQLIAIVRADTSGGRRCLDFVKWGLIPAWSKDPSIGNKMINARAETAAEKPAFRSAFKHRRCLVPADGFYEWKKTKDGRRRPFLAARADGAVFAFAGLWETWTGPEGRVVQSGTVLTTDANELMASIHDRMPVILDPEHYGPWLDPGFRDQDLLTHLLRPYPSNAMTLKPVGLKVNKASYDAPDCVEDYIEAPDE
ncbi:MAG: SOS response-associated peptidase [Pseudomonadota bacterium]